MDKGDSETMSVIGTTIWGIFSKYWIFLVGAMFLIVSLQESVDVFKIIYMVLFLLIVNIFLVSVFWQTKTTVKIIQKMISFSTK